MMKQYKANGVVNIRLVCAVIAVAYVALAVAFYFLADEQLRLRESRGNVALTPAQTGVAELTQGVVVEQSFAVNIQRLQQIGVQWGTAYRANAGSVTMELIDTRDGACRMQKTYDAAAVSEGTVLTMDVSEPLTDIYGVPLVLRLYADSQPGSALTPLMTAETAEDYTLMVNGQAVDGRLCMTASGQDNIWLGLHYWEFVAAGGLLLVLGMVLMQRKKRNGKRSFVVNALIALKKYRFLIQQLVSRDFKTKYTRSILGMFWSFLNPLLTMCIQYVVFSTIFKTNIPNYAVYLLIGIVMFNFFSEACGMSLTSILGNAGLITKVYIPKYIYPLTRVMSSVINLSISLLPLILMAILTGVTFHKSAVLALFFLVCLIMFSLGIGLLLSSSMVFFRDTQFLWNVFNMMWMYATPVFYPETILPENFRMIFKLNPLYHFLTNCRICILNGVSPEPINYLLCLAIAVGMLLLGSVVFNKAQNKFVLYL